MILSSEMQTQIQEAMAGNAITRLTLAKINRLKFAVPPIAEQRAIAAALGDLDELIAASGRGIAKRRDLKQAAMQQLLTGRTRLPGFADPWATRKLGELASFQSGGTPRMADPTLWVGDVPWVSPKDMKVPRLHDVPDRVSIKALSNGTRLAPTGAIFIVIRGMILAHTFPVARCERPLAFNQDIKALITHIDVDSEFLLYWLTWSGPTILEICDESTHGTKRLPTLPLQSLNVLLPPLAEQRAIAAVLADFDAELEALEAERAKWRLVKQGAMQELLTGRTRLV